MVEKVTTDEQRGLNRDQVVKIGRLRGSKKFVCKSENLRVYSVRSVTVSMGDNEFIEYIVREFVTFGF